MFQVMYGGCSGNDVEVTFSLEADDQDALMHDFLSELLYLSDARGIVFCSFEVRIEDTSLHATVRGIPFDPARHAGGREIKGVSYSGLRIVKEEESYCMDVIFDV